MIITKISQQVRDPERANVYVDGKFYAGLSKIVVLQLGLKVGTTLTPELAAKLAQNESSQNIWDYSLKSLSASPKSKKQLTRKLAAKYEAEAVEATVARLEDAGLLDDAHLAEMLIGREIAIGSKSTREIEAKLLQKGLPKDLVREVLEIIPEEYELETAARLARIKNKGTEVSSETSLKIAQYLGRKGFDYSVARKALALLSRDVE